MAEFIGFSGFLSDLLEVLIKITVQTTTFFIKTTIKGFVKFLFDTLRYFEMMIDHIEHLFKR
jgi:hypothetical protein